MSPLTQTLLINLVVIAVTMVALWCLSLRLKDASIVDPFWGSGFVIVAGISWLVNAPTSGRAVMLIILTALWGLRLSGFLLWRSTGKSEDSRYAAMRSKHGPEFWWVSLLTVFCLQGIILWFVSLPIQVTATLNSSPLGLLDLAGVSVFCLGLFFETVGDWQLATFKSDPSNSGKVLDKGLWRYTRHPNYFGDFCVWWGIYLVAAAGGAAWTIGSPLLMSVLLMKISGVTLLESTIADRRPEYAAYKKRTNAFFPGPPRTI